MTVKTGKKVLAVGDWVQLKPGNKRSFRGICRLDFISKWGSHAIVSEVLNMTERGRTTLVAMITPMRSREKSIRPFGLSDFATIKRRKHVSQLKSGEFTEYISVTLIASLYPHIPESQHALLENPDDNMDMRDLDVNPFTVVELFVEVEDMLGVELDEKDEDKLLEPGVTWKSAIKHLTKICKRKLKK